MQVPPQPLAFLLPRHHQPLPAGPQGVGEQRGLDGHAAVPAEVGEQVQLLAAQPAPGRDGDGPDPHVPRDEVDPRRLLAREQLPPAVHVAGGLDLAPRHPQRRSDGRGQPGQDGVDAGRGVGLLGQPLQRPVGIAQVAVEQAVHQRGEPRAQRMDREGRAPGDHRDAEVGQVLPQQPEHGRDQDREPGDQRGEHGVDEGLPDDDGDGAGASSQDGRGELRGQQATGDDVERLGCLRPPGVAEDDEQHERRGRQEDADDTDPLVRPGPAQPHGVGDEAEHEGHLEQDRVQALEPRPDAARQQAHRVGDVLQLGGHRRVGTGGRPAHRRERRQRQALHRDDRADDRPPPG